MRASLLGHLRLAEGGREIATGGRRTRAVLAYLLLHADTVIPSERLQLDLWGDDPPPGAANALQAAVSRLRKVLPAGRLVTTPQGYRLHLLAGELDLAQFAQDFAQGSRALAAGRAQDAARMMASAVALWRGPALADFRFEPFAQSQIARLEEMRIACHEGRIEADLATGAGPELVAELKDLVAEHPLRERFHGQLMLALYRSGRQAEALEAYREARAVLEEELGIDPSPALARIEQAVLRQEAWLVSGSSSVLRSRPAPASSAASRRPVTVLCIDVQWDAASAAADPLDPETLHWLGGRVTAALAAVVERHGGHLSAAQGPRLLGVFGVAVVHEDDAQRAAAAAIECDEALRLEQASVASAHGVTLRHRLGVATTEALVTDTAALTFAGEAVAVANALVEAAEVGQALVSEQTFELASGALDVERLPTGRLVLRAVRLGVRSLPVRLVAPVLGRTEELGRLLDSCATAQRSRSTVFVTLVGEAGQGKTRTVRELSDRLDGGYTVLTGRCLPYGEGITFWPLRELVDQMTGGRLDRGAIRELLGDAADGDVVTDRLVRAFGQGEPGTSDTSEIFWATRRLLAAIARLRPLVVVLDDVHWAQPPFLALIESIAVQPAAAPLVVLCLTRPELLEERPDWL
ncbi:MAG: BTAD domain-containing putative transcriptional regulator, partial [Kineosporiaceae bacterium]